MKNIYLFLCLIICIACSKDDNQYSQDPVSQLPEATKTGENTVGCLVNGEVFLPKGGGLAGNTNCFYQYVDGGYHFGLQVSQSASGVRSVLLGTKNSIIEEENTYVLNARPFFANNENGKGGGYTLRNFNESIEDLYSTTSESNGEMTITKLDFENNIVSGTFWFDAINEEGEIVKIREGRFDMQFSQ